MLPDDQVHPDTHVLTMVNNVIGMVNYVIAARPSLRNFVIADILVIVQIALGPFVVGPMTASGNMTFYPPAALTVIVVIALGIGFGLAIGTMVATAIRNEPASAPEQASAEADNQV